MDARASIYWPSARSRRRARSFVHLFIHLFIELAHSSFAGLRRRRRLRREVFFCGDIASARGDAANLAMHADCLTIQVKGTGGIFHRWTQSASCKRGATSGKATWEDTHSPEYFFSRRFTIGMRYSHSPCFNIVYCNLFQNVLRSFSFCSENSKLMQRTRHKKIASRTNRNRRTQKRDHWVSSGRS